MGPRLPAVGSSQLTRLDLLLPSLCWGQDTKGTGLFHGLAFGSLSCPWRFCRPPAIAQMVSVTHAHPLSISETVCHPRSISGLDYLEDVGVGTRTEQTGPLLRDSCWSEPFPCPRPVLLRLGRLVRGGRAGQPGFA